jgi:hypothetical protein
MTSIDELLHRAGVSNDDPLMALSSIALLRVYLEDRESDVVRKARAEGRSWAQIADALGRSKQSVWEKYRDPHERSHRALTGRSDPAHVASLVGRTAGPALSDTEPE